MKKILIIGLSLFVFACGESADNTTTGSEDAAAENENIEESVEIGAGEEVSPQLDLDSASDERLDVDTVSRKKVEDQQE